MRHDEEHHPLRPHTHVAYHHVEKACASDVELLCTRQETPETFGDPFLDWMLLPSSTTSDSPFGDMDDIGAIMDRMMGSVLVAPPFTTTITVFTAGVERTPEEASMQDINFVVDSTAAKLATEKEPEELPELAEQLQTYGHELMIRSEEGNPEHHLGRRLTEMDANTLHHHVRLPFGCEKNACLLNAAQQFRVSPDCAHSIEELQIVNQLEKNLEERQEATLRFMAAYLVVLMLVLIVALKKSKQNNLRRRLGQKILLAIYSNPELKRQVEEELGESVGNTPPVHRIALKMMGAQGSKLKRAIRCRKFMFLSYLLLVLYIVLAAPSLASPLFMVLMLGRLVFLCGFASKANADECKCCCCGATTTNGGLTEAQECCSCCKGTGVCSPACASCCETGDGCCNCCGGAGCCCPSKGATTVKDPCTCCCCGATPEQVAAGTLTAEQECCSCCKGTGTCSPACASCCGGGGCCCCGGKGCCCCKGCCCAPKVGQGQKHVFQSKTCVYQGVPVQIV